MRDVVILFNNNGIVVTQKEHRGDILAAADSTSVSIMDVGLHSDDGWSLCDPWWCTSHISQSPHTNVRHSMPPLYCVTATKKLITY